MKITSTIHYHDNCPTCGQNKIVTDDKIGESCCANCGCVISENIVDRGAEWRSFAGDLENKSRTGDQTSLLIHDMGLSTVIGKINKDGTGKPISIMMKNSFIRLRRENSRIQSKKQLDKNFIQAFSDMNNLKVKLALSDSIMETAAYRYRKAVERGLIRGRSIRAMVGACVYFACRNANISRSLHDVAKTINLPKREIAKCYRILLKEFEIIVPPPSPITSISKIGNSAGLSEKTMRETLEILEKEQDMGGFAGKDPRAITAAVLYVVSRKYGEKKSQKDMAKAAGVTEVTVRNRVRGLSKSILQEYSVIRKKTRKKKISNE